MTIATLKGHADMSPGLTAALEVNRKDAGPSETIIWGGKTYKITVMKKGQASNPATRAEWDKLKEEHKAFLTTVDKLEHFQGARRIRYSSSAKSLTVFEAGKDKRIIDLEARFKDETVPQQDRDDYARLSSSVQTIIFKSFTSTVPLETTKPGTDSTATDAQTNAARANRLGSATQCLEDGDVVSYLEQLQKANNRLAFAYVSPLNEAKQPVPLNFVSHFQGEYIKNTALSTNSDNMIFAMPYLEDATPAQAGHYKLVLINFAQPVGTISHYDSLGHAPNAAVKAQLALLAADLNSKYGRAFSIADQGNTAHQTDGSSCGHFVLNCVEHVLAGGTPATYMSLAAPSASELAEMKQNLAKTYQDATAPAAVVPTQTPAPSISSSTAASTTTPTATLSTTVPAATPYQLESFERHPDDIEKESRGVLAAVGGYVANWWNGKYSDENSSENFSSQVADSLTSF